MTRTILLSTWLVLLVGHTVEAQDSTRQLTAGPSASRAPSWQPDGRRLAFESERNGTWDIYAIDIVTGRTSAMTTSSANDRYPAWSPTGEHLVFVSDRDGDSDLYVLDVGSDRVERLAVLPGEEFFPAWSADGRTVMFTLVNDATFRLMTIDLANREASPMVADTGRDLWPRASPTGDRVAFFSRRDTDGEDDEIYLLERSTGAIRRLTDRPGHDFCPVWNPAGTRLLVVSIDPAGSRALRVIETERGTELGRLATAYHRVTEPAWSPDGRLVAYAARVSPTEPYQVFVEPTPGFAR